MHEFNTRAAALWKAGEESFKEGFQANEQEFGTKIFINLLHRSAKFWSSRSNLPNF